MRTITTVTGAAMPVLGLGTWRMGEKGSAHGDEVAALRLGLELGVRLIDTAEMYGDGRAESIVAEAIGGRRDELFLVSKVLPQNASRRGTMEAAERSLRRLRTDRIDLYLLHWESSHPIEDTVAAFVELRQQGKVLHYGVSNFDLAQLEEARSNRGGEAIASNQVLYNLARRGIEADLLPRCAQEGIAVMAYSPLEQGRLEPRPSLAAVATRHGVTTSQVALAWTIARPGTVTIPKATRPQHVRDDVAAADLLLDADDLAALDRDYPPPPGPVPLETL
jgi:diketogulonate reductase-like aldo/keto reductase